MSCEIKPKRKTKTIEKLQLSTAKDQSGQMRNQTFTYKDPTRTIQHCTVRHVYVFLHQLTHGRRSDHRQLQGVSMNEYLHLVSWTMTLHIRNAANARPTANCMYVNPTVGPTKQASPGSSIFLTWEVVHFAVIFHRKFTSCNTLYSAQCTKGDLSSTLHFRKLIGVGTI